MLEVFEKRCSATSFLSANGPSAKSLWKSYFLLRSIFIEESFTLQKGSASASQEGSDAPFHEARQFLLEKAIEQYYQANSPVDYYRIPWNLKFFLERSKNRSLTNVPTNILAENIQYISTHTIQNTEDIHLDIPKDIHLDVPETTFLDFVTSPLLDTLPPTALTPLRESRLSLDREALFLLKTSPKNVKVSNIIEPAEGMEDAEITPKASSVTSFINSPRPNFIHMKGLEIPSPVLNISTVVATERRRKQSTPNGTIRQQQIKSNKLITPKSVPSKKPHSYRKFEENTPIKSPPIQISNRKNRPKSLSAIETITQLKQMEAVPKNDLDHIFSFPSEDSKVPNDLVRVFFNPKNLLKRKRNSSTCKIMESKEDDFKGNIENSCNFLKKGETKIKRRSKLLRRNEDELDSADLSFQKSPPPKTYNDNIDHFLDFEFQENDI